MNGFQFTLGVGTTIQQHPQSPRVTSTHDHEDLPFWVLLVIPLEHTRHPRVPLSDEHRVRPRVALPELSQEALHELFRRNPSEMGRDALATEKTRPRGLVRTASALASRERY